MPYYVVKRTDQRGGYLTPPGSLRSYTTNLHNARRFNSAEEAKAECCPENEIAVKVD
jgi:hypothetical protein